jgi:hypothetical protein
MSPREPWRPPSQGTCIPLPCCSDLRAGGSTSMANNELQIKTQLAMQEKGLAQASTIEDQVNFAWTKVGKSSTCVGHKVSADS